MWKLTIYQVKKYDTWESEQEVSYLSPHIDVLTMMVAAMSRVETSEKTRYEIKEVEEDVH